jgi:hypothetical protein
VRLRKKEWSRREEEEGESFGSFLPWSLRSHTLLSPMTFFSIDMFKACLI